MQHLPRRGFLLGLVTGATIAGTRIATAVTPPQPLPALAVGQMWTIDGEPETTRLIVGRTDFEGAIVHISVIGIQVPVSATDPSGTTSIGHLPFARSVLAHSVRTLIASDAKPHANFEEGYATWKQNKGGVFTLPVNQVIDMVMKIRNGEKPA